MINLSNPHASHLDLGVGILNRQREICHAHYSKIVSIFFESSFWDFGVELCMEIGRDVTSHEIFLHRTLPEKPYRPADNSRKQTKYHHSIQIKYPSTPGMNYQTASPLVPALDSPTSILSVSAIKFLTRASASSDQINALSI